MQAIRPDHNLWRNANDSTAENFERCSNISIRSFAFQFRSSKVVSRDPLCFYEMSEHLIKAGKMR